MPNQLHRRFMDLSTFLLVLVDDPSQEPIGVTIRSDSGRGYRVVGML